MISGSQKEAIKNITQRIVTTFGTEYLRAMKFVFIRDAKNARNKPVEEDSSIEVEGKVYPDSTPENPLRPRGNKIKKELTMELKVKITSWTTFDDDIDPYVAFIVEASLGELSSSIYRRFTHFRSLHKMAKKKYKDLKKQFPNAKSFEGRKFEYEYLIERKNKLQAYLDMLLKKDGGAYCKDEGFLKWLGLGTPEDPKFQEIFDIAYQNTKWRLWIWKRVPYDNEEEAIAKLAIEEIKREVIYEIVSPIPGFIRSPAAASVYKGISATVGTAVAAGWKAARETVKPLKPKISEVVEGAIEKYLEVEDMVKGKLIEGINKGLSPVIEALEPILRTLSENFMETGFNLLKEVYPYTQDVSELFDKICETGDQKLVPEIEKLVNEKKKGYPRENQWTLTKSLRECYW
jgi:hypothetical protein